MKKSALLASTGLRAAPGAAEAPPAPEPREKGEGKPIPAIGTMRKGSTQAQRQAHHKMTVELKKAARGMRYEQHLQSKSAVAKA